GLPGDVITGLAAEPGGAVWAIGSGGASRRDPDSGIWTMISTLNSTAIASDPSGRVWLGTTDGLWQYNKVTWTVYRTSMTLLDSNRILGLASDGLRTWVASGGNVQARADFNGPIGFIPPYINSFVPVAGGVSDPVSLYGGGYDIRRTSNNTVSFGNLSDPMTYGAVTYVDAGQINVEVPLLALSGQIWVRANRLNGASAGSFTVIPKIRSVTPTCAAMGGELTIEGSGFNSTNEASYIKIGNGPWRFADAQTPTGLRYRLRPGDGDGTVSVRVGVGGTPVTSTQSVTIDTPVIDQVGIQQGIQGLPLVWAKRTLIMLSMRSQRGLCSSRVDGGKLEFKLKDGSTREDWLSFQPTAAGLTIGPVAPPLGVSNSVNFVMWSQALSRPDFSINDFDGVRLHLFSGPVEVVTYDVPNNSFFFTDLDSRRQHMNVYIYDTSIASNASWDAFYKNAEKGLDHVARAYPQSDLGAYYGRDKWMTWAWRTIGRTGLVDLSGDDTFHRLQGQVEDIRSSANDNGGNYDQAMGVIEASLRTGNTSGKATYDCSNPFGDCDMHSAVAFNTTDNLAHTWMQEAIHTMGWIADSSPNHDGGNKTHSRYNNSVGGTCTPAITFRQALVDQLGYAARVVRLEYGKTPVQFLFADCTTAQMPNSVMSYAPGSQDNNSFLEPLDYFYVFNNIRIFGRTVASGSGIETGTDEIVPGVIDTLGDQFGLTASPQTHQELRLNGEISGDEPHTVTITMSYLDNPGGDLTEPTPGGQYILSFRDASGANLLDFPFSVGTGHTHGAPEKDFRFGLRVPFPDATARVAISHDGQELWSSPVSPGAPLVSLTSPVQYQSYNAVDPLPVTWNASDPDGDPLSFILEYSPDDGATWQTIATGLSGSGYDWIPAFSPVGISRLRITATDGFHTAQATSEQFYIQPDKPIAIIQSPADGQVISEGGEIALVGGVVASESSDPVQFDWYYDGNYAGSGQYLYDYLTDIGAHTIGLQVIANGLPSEMAMITFTVIKDADWDGLPNDYEQSYGINPLDRSDSAADPDGDGLSSLVEFQIGTSPVSADSDGDTMNDGDELEQGGNPSDAGSLPPTAATLNVGAQRMGFIFRQGDPNPDPWTIWITNAGAGALAWTASAPAGWLNVSPAAGSAPTALTLSADPSGLAPGVYTTYLTVSAPGAVGSPRSIPIWIRVYDANGETSYNTYLPVMKK
ncbi:MAG TPA: IPT/TIG domain-containing protein, partial [Anaerolineales bacterium]|nr:IPT/TIG domain-containing protein [Anaerolineales bacterium]